MKYRCLVIEDNLLERDFLAMQLKKIDTISLVKELSDGLEAIQYLKTHSVDIVYSDIDMPDLSGIELLKTLKYPPVFIFISSHPEHAAESFNLDVIDYIVKPVKLDRLIKATHKAIEYINSKNTLAFNQSVKPIADNSINEVVRTIDAQEYIFIKEKNIHIKLNMADILFIESMGDFSKITTIQNKTHFILVGLKNLDKQLPESIFIRVHKQYIVNMLHINCITLNDIILCNKQTIPLSPSYKPSIQENLINKKSLTRFVE
ncbi:MAG: response regulator transcription factor [Bacteroidota bacterium]|nr:response regulator transcription factor [Bacteroidota bacterium]